MAVNALLPINPERMVVEAAHPVFDESVAVLEEIAAALDDGDFERAQYALIKAREINARVSGFKEARAALNVVGFGDPAPESLSEALRDLGRATEALARYLEAPDDPEDTRQFALSAVGSAAALLNEHQDLATNLPINALVDQIHSAAVDILGGTGMDREAALQALGEVISHTSEPG